MHAQLAAQGFHGNRVSIENPLQPSQLIEALQIERTTAGIDLLALPSGCLLHIGQAAVVRVTGLRNPCRQLDDYQHGLMAAVLERDESGRIIRKAGIMGVVVESGAVHPGDAISVTLPREPFSSLECV
jgi:MOSC domain-containing protein YiiM